MATNHGGVLVVSIDLESDVGQPTRASAARLSRTTDWLFDALERLHLPATWALADPAHSALTDRILAIEPGQELAVYGDSTWAGPRAGRRRFAQELGRRVLGARARGLAARSLVVRHAVAAEHIDLLVKYAIAAVRGPVAKQTPTALPQSLRYGVWQLPVSAVLPGPTASWLSGPLHHLQVQRSVRQAAAQVRHLAIDAARLARCGSCAERPVLRTLQLAARWRDQNRVQVETMTRLADRLAPAHRPRPAQSILRQAA